MNCGHEMCQLCTCNIVKTCSILLMLCTGAGQVISLSEHREEDGMQVFSGIKSATRLKVCKKPLSIMENSTK